MVTEVTDKMGILANFKKFNMFYLYFIKNIIININIRKYIIYSTFTVTKCN